VNRIAGLLCATLICTSLAAADVVEINTTKTGEPISKYIYGQFIEHLGHCIYGGIWAETITDRKFYYPITDHFDPWGQSEDPQWKTGKFNVLKASPWKVIGPAGSVTMDSDNAFVGFHSPVVHPNGSEAGISQDGLAVVAGKTYTGHIILAADDSAAPVEVRLVLGDGSHLSQTIDHLTNRFTSYDLTFSPTASSDNVKIEIVSKSTGTFHIGTLSLMPSDNIDGFRPDTIELMKQLDSPVYRWPGGNFVSGYDWRDGIGDRDKRPPRHNPAWSGVESNDVGIHEYMELMQILDADPFVALNTGLGNVQSAEEEVEYLNGAATTPMGQLRSSNGHPDPFNVPFFAVGNEMYGAWQLGHMSEEKYVLKHNDMATAIAKISPNSQLVAVGNIGSWDISMLTHCADHMDLLSEHIYVKDKPQVPAHTAQLAQQIRHVADCFRGYQNSIPSMKGKHIRIAMDEWNYWYGPYIYGELGVQYHLNDALGVARGLHEYFRNSDLFFMANYAQTVNVIGAIKTNRTTAVMDTTGQVLAMYRHHFGTTPVKIMDYPDDLDVSAAWTDDKKFLTVAIVNPTPDAKEIKLRCGQISFAPHANRWLLTGPDAQSINAPGQPPQVTVEESSVDSSAPLQIPQLSVVLYRLQIGG
jgi:alpha-N-arabinofuranosidase